MKTTTTKHRASGFTEFTYTDGEREVMVHHDANGNSIALYTYRKDAETFNGEEDARGKPIAPFVWHDGKNPLFVHLRGRAIARFIAAFIDSGELVCPEREET